MTSADAGSRSAPLAPKIVSEVHELHRRNLELSRAGRGLRGRRNRRERREAREAESDLLRVLGFDNYEAFHARDAQTQDDETLRTEEVAAAPALALVDTAVPNPELEAQQTEAALLRVLRAGAPESPARGRVTSGRDGPRHPVPDAEAGSVNELRRRVAFFEEELAETRFELLNMRDRVRALVREADAERPAGANPAPADPVENAIPAAAAALVEAATELRSLYEILREERAQVAALAADARAEAAHILERAQVDAAALRDEAATAARAVLDQASADAVALTRNAISTVDGLRRLAGEEAGRADENA